MKSGTEMIADERMRQVLDENYDASHDDAHTDGSLANAGAAYALTGDMCAAHCYMNGVPLVYPWSQKGWKRHADRRHQLAIAGALIAAEIDRLNRLETQPETE